MKKKFNATIKVDLLETIAAQNGLTVEYGGNQMDGYIAVFRTPYESNGPQRIQSVAIDMDNNNDILADLPSIYRAAKNLLADRCDYITNKEKEFFEKKKED